MSMRKTHEQGSITLAHTAAQGPNKQTLVLGGPEVAGKGPPVLLQVVDMERAWQYREVSPTCSLCLLSLHSSVG